jgi:hypothetical protein
MVYYIATGFTRMVELGSVEYFVISMIGFTVWWLFVHFVLERWVFGPKDD